MHVPHLNPANPLTLTPQAQEVAKRSGNERVVFWTSVASLGIMGMLAATATAQLIYQMVRDGACGRPQDWERRGRGRE